MPIADVARIEPRSWFSLIPLVLLILCFMFSPFLLRNWVRLEKKRLQLPGLDSFRIQSPSSLALATGRAGLLLRRRRGAGRARLSSRVGRAWPWALQLSLEPPVPQRRRYWSCSFCPNFVTGLALNAFALGSTPNGEPFFRPSMPRIFGKSSG